MAGTSGGKSQGMRFAEEQLQRHGWTEGKGLGKRESGISEAIKVKVKCDNAGVGHDAAEQFTFHWWDHVFNKTASGISVEPDQDGVQVKKVADADSTVTNKKPRKALTNRDMLYGRFIKSATLLSGGEKPVEKESSSESSSDSSEDEDEKLDLSSATKLTDEHLVKICGGRTAHKGARHGLTMSAKLSRIEEQERAFLEKYGKKEANKEPAGTAIGLSLEEFAETGRKGITNEDLSFNTTQRKKKKKRRKTTSDEETLEEDQTNSYEDRLPWKEEGTMTSKRNVDTKELVDAPDGLAFAKKRTVDEEIAEGFHHGHTTDKDRKYSKKKKKDAHEGLTVEAEVLVGHVQPMEDARARPMEVQTSKKKKRKAEKELLNGHQEWTPEDTRLSKKKRRNAEQKNEVEEELLNGQEWTPSVDPRLSKKKTRAVEAEKDEVGEELLIGHREWAPSEDRRQSKKKTRMVEEKDEVEEELLHGQEWASSEGTRLSKKKRRKAEGKVEVEEELLDGHQEWVPSVDTRRSKKENRTVEEKVEVGEELLNGHEWVPSEDTRRSKKKKPRRDLEEKVVEELHESTEEYGQSAKRKKKQKKVEEIGGHMEEEESQTPKRKKRSKNKSKDCCILDEEQAVDGTDHRIQCKGKKQKE
ncbi:G patch domain-containing protein 4 [Mantella aurantiaca]